MPLIPVFLAAALLLASCWGLRAQTAELSSPELFTDVSLQAGITWKHFNGQSRDRFLIEASCGGVAFLDFDNDGWLDIFFVNGGETPKGKSPSPVRNALYRNLGNGKFEDVAESAGVAEVRFYGMGAAGADYDNDGFQDLYVTGFPTSALFHNEGDGTFREVTQQAGLENAGEWAASAAWFDYDRDGQLDLFVCNYAELSFARPRPCNFAGKPEYCSQRAYPPRRPKLYRNNG
ncbi:MAG: VCBS repeat-containing protein, partial [Acidobacteriota bacterium]|nr:VCBS repeat-containing protein [Acidobacteriota bacterium]